MTSTDHPSGAGMDPSGRRDAKGLPPGWKPRPPLAPFGFLVGLTSHRSAADSGQTCSLLHRERPGGVLQAAHGGLGSPSAAEANEAGCVSLADSYQAPYGFRMDSEVHGLHF